ncbi:MAG: hypothetical protein J6K77_07150 [Ruminococcus sp.]|nr:hypothetical protein [Ruminococcus sp.]
MLYLTTDELTDNILAQSEKAAAVIGSIDFKKADMDYNAVIIPFLGNIFDSAMMILALESGCGGVNECYREPRKILASARCLSSEMSGCIASISEMRAEYDGFGGGSGADIEKCLFFLRNYCNFMNGFLDMSDSAQKLRGHREVICGFADTVAEKTGRKKQASNRKPEEDIGGIAALLRQLIKETQRTNELLERLVK